MKSVKRITASLLALVMLLSSVACADDSGKKTGVDTTAAVTTASDVAATTDDRVYPNLPSENYDGYTFTVLHWDRTDWPTRACIDIYSDGETGDPIKDSVFKRNSLIGERYGFEIELLKESPGDVTSAVKRVVQTDEDAYDLVIARAIDNTGLLQSKHYLDINTIPNMDLDAPWYDQNVRENLEIGGKLYLIASDMTIEDKNATAAIAFNKKIATDNDLPDFYDLVREGKWTVETMADIYKPIANDLDGSGKMNEEDLYGFLGGKDFGVSLFFGGGGRIIKEDADGELVVSVLDGDNITMLETLFNLETDSDTFYHHHKMGSDDNTFEALFANGHGLFFWMRLDNVMSLRTTDTDFGILPIPKYTEEQEEYISNVSPWTCGLLTIPVTAKNPARTGLIIEALSAESKYTLQPAYFETTIKYKATRDEDSLEMLDIIVSNRVFDIAEFFRVGTLSDAILEMGLSNAFTIASKMEKLVPKTNTEIEKMMEKMS